MAINHDIQLREVYTVTRHSEPECTIYQSAVEGLHHLRVLHDY